MENTKEKREKVIEYLRHDEAYDAASLNCYAFVHGSDVKDGRSMALGNMTGGFPFSINGVEFHNSECAYISGAFSNDTEEHRAIRRQLVECTNGLLAKRAIRRPNKALIRPDFYDFNVQWMVYVVWQKCQNEDFRRLLLALPDDAVIIENSTFQAGPTAAFWGTRNAELKKLINTLKKELKARGLGKSQIKREVNRRRLGEWSRVGVFEGKNVMGKILMLCREALKNNQEPIIDYDLLNEKNIVI